MGTVKLESLEKLRLMRVNLRVSTRHATYCVGISLALPEWFPCEAASVIGPCSEWPVLNPLIQQEMLLTFETPKGPDCVPFPQSLIGKDLCTTV